MPSRSSSAPAPSRSSAPAPGPRSAPAASRSSAPAPGPRSAPAPTAVAPAGGRATLSDPQVFARVYRRHRRAVMTSAWRVVRDRELAEEVTQDVFAWLWSHPRAYDGRTSLASYLAVIARSRAIDAWRNANARVRLGDRLREEAACADAGEGAIATLIRRDDAAELRALVAELSHAQRQALALTYWAELPMGAVAARLGLPEGTVKSRVRLARERLAERLRPVAA